MGMVGAFWSVAFIVKYSTTFIKEISPDNIGLMEDVDPQKKNENQGKQVFYVLVYFGLNILCDIIPYIACLDSQFIKISTFD
jgi:hypothetical protein